MKIVYVVSQFPSLTETFIAREIQQIVEAGHEVTICILRAQPAAHGPSGIDLSIRKIRMQISPLSLASAQLITFFHQPLLFLKAFSVALGAVFRQPGRSHQILYIFFASTWFTNRMCNEGISYIHCHFLHSESIAAMWMAAFLKIPYGITAHVSSIRHDRKLIKNVITNAGILVGDTSQTLSVYRQFVSHEANLIRNGIDLNKFKPIRNFLPPDQEPPLIISVGSLLHPKGHHILIQACRMLKMKGIAFNCKIIGEGEERPTLERLISENNLTGIVELSGALSFSELRDQYSQASMLVMSSIISPAGSDGLPTVLIEAMALGIPVIGTNHAGIPDLIKHRQTGLLVEPGNPDDLAEAICTLMSDSSLQVEFAKNGRQFVEQEFSLKRNVDKLINLIEQMAVGLA